jgi:Leucine-rich repeat (LRR) protein
MLFLCAMGLLGCGSRSTLSYSDDPDDVVGDREPGNGAPGAGGGSTGSAGSSGIGASGAGGGISVPPPNVDRPPPDLQPGCDRQGELVGDLVVFRQEDLAPLEGCTALDGNLQLSGPLNNLQQLRSLREISGKLSILRGPTSLVGLEQLTNVQDLQLESVRASSLQPLSGLSVVGTLSIGGDVPQGNLNGLSGIRNLRALTLENTSLASLAGLAVPAQMRSIRIANSTVNDLGVLASVSAIDDLLELSGAVGFSTLEVFRNLTRIGSLLLSQNPDLIHIDALAQVTDVDSLVLFENPRLEHVPAFDGLQSLEVLDIERNAVLRNVPSFGQATRIAQITVRQNPRLERVVFSALTATTLPNTSDTNQILIAENQALTQVLMPLLTRASTLTIAANPSLSSVDFGALTFVQDRLTVVTNPTLPSASLSHLLDVQTSQLKLGANQGDAPLVSCPWLGDDRCDEVSLLCSAGSDSQDCSAGSPPY